MCFDKTRAELSYTISIFSARAKTAGKLWDNLFNLCVTVVLRCANTFEFFIKYSIRLEMKE